MITLIATLKCTPGKEDDFKAAMSEMIDAVKANENGTCLAYTLHQSTEDSTDFLMYEQYADQAALDAHGQTDHMKAFGGKLGGIIGGAPSVMTYAVIKGI